MALSRTNCRMTFFFRGRTTFRAGMWKSGKKDTAFGLSFDRLTFYGQSNNGCLLQLPGVKQNKLTFSLNLPFVGICCGMRRISMLFLHKVRV